ncbi:MAG: hypothetical protein ABL907_13360, partial [Hyphomicrobium sp.]
MAGQRRLVRRAEGHHHGFLQRESRQEPVEAQFGGVSKHRQTDGHGVVSSGGLIAIGPEQAIPERQIESEVRV